MERWAGKVGIVTGASVGIGLAIAKALLENGVIVVGLARRKNKMQSGVANVKGAGNFHAYECDISKPESIEKAFQWIKEKFGTVHIMVNNAGIITNNKFMESSRTEWERVFDINVIGFLDCTKRAARMMLDANVEGYVININSITGHQVVNFPGICYNVYPASKHASVAATEIMQKELHGSKIRITSISPGLVETEILQASNYDFDFSDLDFPVLLPKDVADAVIYCIGTPQRVNITELTIRPLGEVKYF